MSGKKVFTPPLTKDGIIYQLVARWSASDVKLLDDGLPQQDVAPARSAMAAG